MVRQKLDTRITATTVEFFHKGKRVASHQRSYQKGRHTTVTEHMLPNYRQYLEWTPERFLRWAQQIGPHTKLLAEKIFAARQHPQQAFRTLLGIFRLGKTYTDQRLDAACSRALLIGTTSFGSVESILKNGLDAKPVKDHEDQEESVQHRNIRGAGYYQTTIQ